MKRIHQTIYHSFANLRMIVSVKTNRLGHREACYKQPWSLIPKYLGVRCNQKYGVFIAYTKSIINNIIIITNYIFNSNKIIIRIRHVIQVTVSKILCFACVNF